MSFSYGSPLWPLFQSIFGVSTSLRNALIRRLTVTTPVHYSGRAGLLCWLSSHSTGNPRQDYAKGMSVSPFSLLYSCLCCFQQLNAINVNVFTPCLLFSKVAFSLSAGMLYVSLHSTNVSLTSHWHRRVSRAVDHPPVFHSYQWRILGSGMATCFSFQTQPQAKVCFSPNISPHSSLNTPSRNFAMAAAMIMNSNSLPVALLQSLAISVPGLEWGQDDTIDSIVGRALTYILLSGTTGQFVSFFYH